MEAHGHKARCVVWCGRGLAAPARLDEALASSGCAGVHVDNEFDAMAALCKARRAGEGSTVLLAVEPATLAAMGEVLEVAERYAPEVLLWAYESRPAERIRAVTAEERSAWTTRAKGWLEGDAPAPEPRIQVTASGPHPLTAEARATRSVRMMGGNGQPKLKLTGEGPGIPAGTGPGPVHGSGNGAATPDNHPPAQGFDAAASPARAPHLLTDEELAMLLAIEPPKGHN